MLSGLMTTLPLAPWVTEATVSVSPSTSLSLVSTAIVTAVSSLVVAPSAGATGASLTGVTVMVAVAGVASAAPLSSLAA